MENANLLWGGGPENSKRIVGGARGGRGHRAAGDHAHPGPAGRAVRLVGHAAVLADGLHRSGKVGTRVDALCFYSDMELRRDNVG